MACYGEEYFRSIQQRLVHMSSVSSSDTGPFLEALKHAILSPRPKPFYYPGASAWALPLLYRHCPTSLSDTILSRIFTSSDAQPAEVLNSWFVLSFGDANGAGITHPSHISPDFLSASKYHSISGLQSSMFTFNKTTARFARGCITNNGSFFLQISPDFP